MTGESRYCTAADLRALIPDVHRDAALADSFGGANADAGLLDLVLSSACDEVDALISGRVRLPLPPDAIPSKLRTAAALIAAETLYIRRGLDLPSALAEKVKWWRDWLSKIGEGDLRLAADPDAATEPETASAGAASIVARPALTGSHGLLGLIAVILGLSAAFIGTESDALAAVGHRTFSLAAPPDPATFSAVPSIEWERGESVTLDLSGPVLAAGQFPSWQVADVSNLWMDVASSSLSFHAAPDTAALPPGRYMGRVVVTNTDSSLVRVLAVQNVRVLPGAPDLCPPEPASTLATTAWVEGLAESISNALHQADAAFADDIAGLQEAVENRLPAERDIESDEGGYIVSNPVDFRGDLFIHSETFGGHVYWDGLTDHLANLDTATNALTDRIDSLYGEMKGGWKFPDYFSLDAIHPGTSEGIQISEATATNYEYNVAVESGYSRRYKGWELVPRIVRQSNFEDRIEWCDSAEGTVAIPLTYSNNYVLFPGGLDWDMLDSFDDQAMAGAVNRYVTGRLGGFELEAYLEWSPTQRNPVRISRFVGPAPGSLLAACWSNVVGTASNAYAQGKSTALRTWPEGYGSGTNHVSAGWNPNFWAKDLGDFSCVSYHTDTRPGVQGGCVKPVTMVTPRHAVVADHWKPLIGSNVYFVGRSGAILTNQVVDYRNVAGDLTVARMAEAMSTNEVAPAVLLASGWHGYLYGSTNGLNNIFGVPVVGFNVYEQGYLMNWTPTAIKFGKTAGSSRDDGTFALAGASSFAFPYFRAAGVGGDSGSPVFWPVDGRTVLLGCFTTGTTGVIPEKNAIDSAIASAWGDEERTAEYDLQLGGWTNPDIPGAPR